MIRDIAAALAPLAPDTLGEAVFARFQAEPDTLGLAVVDEAGVPVGFVDRVDFMLKIGSAYGRPLYGGRPISIVMDPAPLIVDRATPVAEFTGAMLAGSPSDLLRGFIVTENGRYVGVGSILALLQASESENRRQAAALRALTETLTTAEAEIRAREASARLLFEENPVPLIVFDPDSLVLLAVNPAACQQYGYTQDQFLALTAGDVLAPEEHAAARSQAPHERYAYAPARSWRHMRSDGERLDTHSYFRTLDYGGRTAVIAAALDVTPQKRAEAELQAARDQAEAASRAKTQFLANMSHEIRTPLNGVTGVVSVLARTGLAPDQREMVQIIEDSATTLELLLSDVLDLARVESGKVELRREAFQIEDIARRCASLFRSRAHGKGLAFEVEIEPAARGAHLGDPGRLQQILNNLLSNAVKFTGQGAVRLRVSREADGAHRFEVSDTGIGFDAAAAAKIFQRFEQADGSITRQFGGTGLGLAISRDLAQLMGGELTARSAPGQGSTFSLSLPLQACAEPSPAKALNEAEEIGVPSAGAEAALRILVADDHATNRQVVDLILRAVGAELTMAEDGAQALQAFETARFDLVLMDLQMPVMDGLTAVRHMRRLEADGRPRTPILALSANAMPEHVAAAREAGADGHVAKPILADALITAIDAVLTALQTQAEAA